MSDKELGLLLINAGYLNQSDIIDSLQHYFIGVVRRLFTWVEGTFRFEADQMPPSGLIPVRIDLENLIIEGARQLREWEPVAGGNSQPGYGAEIHGPAGNEPAQYQFERGRVARGFLCES